MELLKRMNQNIRLQHYNVNKSWKYLLPMLKTYGSTFTRKFENLFKLGAGFQDQYYKQIDKRAIFILVDKMYIPKLYNNTIVWLRNQHFYIDDYPFDDILNGRKQMIVIIIPEEFNNAYDNFLFGKYSQMFDSSQIKLLFNNEKDDKSSRASAYHVLNRTKKGYNRFIKCVKESFDTTIVKKDLVGMELDFPPEKHKEVFNFEYEIINH